MSDTRWQMLLTPDRLGARRPGTITPERSPFQRDFDRIVFSGSFRRLQDKTQVFPLVKTDYVRTRLTHSIETSSVGRSLGSAVGVFLCKNFDMGAVRPSDVGAVVAAADTVLCKRFSRVRGEIRLDSDNPAGRSWRITAKELEWIGLVVRKISEL